MNENEFSLETTTLWDFPDRGSWATHDGTYRGNWSPFVPRNLMLRYSSKGDMVLDQFVGGGTSLVEAKLLGRNIIGVDVSEKALERCRAKCKFHSAEETHVYVKKGDARRLDFLKAGSIDMICTHPPYADAIRYSDDEKDISTLSVEDFLRAMEKVANESFRVLKPGGICAYLIGDIRKHKAVYPLGFYTFKLFLSAGFSPKEIVIKKQNNCKLTKFWEEKSRDMNFLLLAHEYLFVLKK